MVTSPTRFQRVSTLDVQKKRSDAPPRVANSFFSLANLPKGSLFGTDGIRGKVGELLNAPLALQIGFWAGQVFKDGQKASGPVIVGQDSRNSSDMLAMSLAAGLTSAGVEVWNLGVCPTPCVAYLTSITDAIGGIMISASHNPPQDNGIKFFSAKGIKLSAADNQKIEAGLRGHSGQADLSLGCGKCYERPTLLNHYIESLQKSLPRHQSLSGMRIVLDLAWGASVALAPSVFQALGAEVISLHEKPDGDRINVNCGSTHLDILQKAVVRHQADLGFAFDGDADRVMAVDNQGRAVDGDYILYLWGKVLKEKGELPNNLLIATVMANLGFEKAWQKLGGEMLRTKVGDKHVQAEMFNTGAMLGGEQSGHVICHHYSYSGDGVQTALHIASVVSQSGVSLAELVDNSFTTYPQLLRNVRVEDRERRLNWQDCEPVQQAIAHAEKEMADQGRILVRASGTEPVIRVMVEAVDAALACHWSEQLVLSVQKHLA